LKNLAKIVLAGLVCFIVISIGQEWDYFSSRWFDSAGDPEPALDRADEDLAFAAVRQTLALMAHLYTSDGDARFAERMPVTTEIMDEIQSDITYLRKYRRVQEPRLQKLELLGSGPAGADRLELRTREFWIHRTFWLDGIGESDPPRSVILHARYRLLRDNRRWRIVAWDLNRPGTE
jgi:hypothetical protein